MITQAVSGSKPRQSAMATGSQDAYNRPQLPPPPGRQARTSFFDLAPAERSLASEIRPLAGMSGLPEAIAAAKAGDRRQLDRIELAWLNTWGPRPPVERYTDDERLVIRALEIQRLGGGTVIKWGLVRPCGRCSRRVRCDLRCRFCGGHGHLSDDYEVVYTDLEGNEVAI